MIRVSRAVAAAVAIAAAVQGGARAEEPAGARRARIGLDRLRASGVSPALAAAVEERVCAALAEVADADVTCPSDVAAAALVARDAAVFGACASDDCMRRVDEVRAADRRVSGSVEKAGAGLVLTLEVGAGDGSTRRVVEPLPEDLEEIEARLPAAVRKLLR